MMHVGQFARLFTYSKAGHLNILVAGLGLKVNTDAKLVATLVESLAFNLS